MPENIRPKDLPIIYVRKYDIALLMFVKAPLIKGIDISDNSRNKLK
jgi:hypothetical protein